VLLVALGAIAALVASAVPAGAQSGEVNISGSSTVEPITSLVAELYAEENPDVPVRVDGPGTGDGFQLFCEGTTDMSDASRAITQEEIDACAAAGIEYTELVVAIDGLTVVANKASKVKCLSFADLYAIFGPESGGGETDLADASALSTELGGSRAPKKGTVEKFTPGPESGTYDSFIEITYEGTMDERLESGDIPEENTGTNDEGEAEVTEPLIAAGTFPNDNDIVQRVEAAKNGLGFFGFAYFVENKAGLKAVKIEDPDTGECVKPTVKTIQDGSYPIARLLYVYPNNAKVADNAAVKAFGDFYFSEENLTDSVEQAGYVVLPEEDVQATIDAWEGIPS
jgi:phosphate transport system substrate-binding protein